MFITASFLLVKANVCYLDFFKSIQILKGTGLLDIGRYVHEFAPYSA
jgi:hypothetical protein